LTGSARPIARGGAVALLALALVACGGIWEEPSSPRTGTFELTSIPDVSVATGEHKYIQLLALGAGDQPVQFTAEGLPPFATLTGDLISLAPERHHAGEALVTVTATSGTLTASRSFTVRVSRTNSAPYLWPPYLEDADGTSLMAGMASDGLWERVARGFPKLTAQIDDSDGDAVQLFVEIVPNGTPFTGVATFTSPATAGGAVEAWGSVYLTGLTPGTYRLQVWAKDVVGEVTAPRDAGRLIYAPRGQRSSAPDWRTCGGASVNVTEDPQHCGACGHDCLGGSCQVGLCTPTQLAATSDFWIDDMELDEGHVYWSGLYTNHFGVKRVPKTGGALQQLASPYMGSLVLDGASFYVTTPGEVVQVPLAGGAPTRLAWGLYAAEGLGLHDGRLYWFLPDESRLWALYSLPKQGGELATREATFAARPQSMVVDASGVYAADIEGGVLHRPATGGSVKVLASGLKEPNGIAVDGEYVYVAYYSPFACWQCTTTLARIPKTGGPLQILATVNMKAGGFTIDDEYIYWTLYGRPADVPLSLGSVMRMPKAGGTPVVLADGHSNVRAIRVDATHVYWIAPEVGVFRVPK
jgi:sugar lactone lactonase YvrE